MGEVGLLQDVDEVERLAVEVVITNLRDQLPLPLLLPLYQGKFGMP